ncbi:unnamed protein product [Closterium sp. NIES-53]
MAGLPGTHFLFSRRPAIGNTHDYSQWQSRPAPPAPRAPPAPPAPPAPLAPPTPPAPPAPPIVVINGQPVLQLLPRGYLAFDAYISEPERSAYDEPGPGLSPRWGDAEDCPCNESATGVEDDVEWWAADGLPEDLPVPSSPPPNKKRPHPSKQNRDARPPSPRSKPSTHKRNSYTSQEKLQWIAKLESGAGELEGAHGARKRLHGRGRASWYHDMEIEVYSRVLAHRKKCLAVSVDRLQKWSHEVMKILHPEVTWAGS